MQFVGLMKDESSLSNRIHAGDIVMYKRMYSLKSNPPCFLVIEVVDEPPPEVKDFTKFPCKWLKILTPDGELRMSPVHYMIKVG